MIILNYKSKNLYSTDKLLPVLFLFHIEISVFYAMRKIMTSWRYSWINSTCHDLPCYIILAGSNHVNISDFFNKRDRKISFILAEAFVRRIFILRNQQ